MRSKADVDAAIRRERRAVLIVNTRSRRGRRRYPEALRLLGDAGFTFSSLHPVDDPHTLPRVFTEVLAAEPDLVIVGGGDGTLKEAVRHLVHRDVVLGLLPLGTTNNFARGLLLPLDLAGAVSVIAEGKVADVDLGELDPEDGGPAEIFANMVSLGLSVRVAGTVPHRLKRHLGRAAYFLTALRRLPRHDPFSATVTIGGERHAMVTHQLNVANGSHHSGRPIARDASPDDRLLAIYRLGGPARIRLLSATARHVLTGHRRTLAEPSFLTTDEVEVATDPPMPVDVDGELRTSTPFRVRLLPNALRVMVPRHFTDT
ncbi:diacylglycerol/lipid kinase family protein [Actinocorallia longicatena]|uniref:Lipid kinase YegS n=1 Tax=Actinocorallia longicatena TaxID=111803 RepID=A0ABP6QG97_9ACTN